MESISAQEKLENAQRVAGMLGYITPLLAPPKVILLVQYLGDLLDENVAMFLEPHFRFAQSSDNPKEGITELARILEVQFSHDRTYRVVSMEKETLVKVGQDVEKKILDTVFGQTTIEEGVDAILNGCTNHESYIEINAGLQLPYDLTFLPKRAVSRAAVILRLAEKVLPEESKLYFLILQVLCQAYLKLCFFEDCLDEIDRVMHSRTTLGPEAQAYLFTYKGMALGGIGKFTEARIALAMAEKEALKIEKDTSALCFALSEIYRLGLATGDFTGLLVIAKRLDSLCADISSFHIRVSVWSFLVIFRSQLGKDHFTSNSFKKVIEVANSCRSLDAEVNARCQAAHFLEMGGRHDEVVKMMIESRPLIQLSGNQQASSEMAALIYRKCSFDTPALETTLPMDWYEVLPLPKKIPFIPAIDIAVGQNLAKAAGPTHDSREEAKNFIHTIKMCEQIRVAIPEDQLPRFMARFERVYEIFINLPTYDFLLFEEYLSILRITINLFEKEKNALHLQLARALLQRHYSKRRLASEGKDRLDILKLENILDPDNSEIKIDLAYETANHAKISEATVICQEVLSSDQTSWKAHRLLGLLASNSQNWEKAVYHFDLSINLSDFPPTNLVIEYGESLFNSGNPRKAIQVIEPHLKGQNLDPIIFFLVAECYAKLENKEKECQYLIEFVKKGTGSPKIPYAKARLKKLEVPNSLIEVDEVSSTSTIPGEEIVHHDSFITDDERSSISDPSKYRACSKCERSVYDLGSPPAGGAFVVDIALSRISGAICLYCNCFYCIYPCTLAGTIKLIRLCPNCRKPFVSVLG